MLPIVDTQITGLFCIAKAITKINGYIRKNGSYKIYNHWPIYQLLSSKTNEI